MTIETEPKPLAMMSNAEVLAAIAEADAAVDKARERLYEVVGVARDRALPWTAIGRTLNVTRQAAWERFSRHVARRAEAAS